MSPLVLVGFWEPFLIQLAHAFGCNSVVTWRGVTSVCPMSEELSGKGILFCVVTMASRPGSSTELWMS